MQLPPEQVERFYAIWFPLLLFVNRQLKLVPDMLAPDFAGPWDVAKARILRDALWADDSVREAFVLHNPAGLSVDDLAVVASWCHRKAGKFFVLRHLKKYSVFLDEKNSTLYGVVGLASPLEDLFPFVPCYVEIVLLPFDGPIIYDSLLMPYNIHFGKGFRDRFERTYKDAKERGAIITSLLPSAPASPEEQQAAARTTDAKVLEAFRARLYGSGLSAKVVERDLDNVTAFAEGYLLNQPEPRSLRDLGSEQFAGYLAQLSGPGGPSEAKRRQALTSFKRFVRFLRDTERMDYETAEDVLQALKGKG